MRHSLFQQRAQKAHLHNSQPRLWNAVVNHFTDRTPAELSQLRGLRLMHISKKGGRPGVVRSHLRGQFLNQVRSDVVPDAKSWAHIPAVQLETNQGGCGSCWAVATMNALSANAQINGHNTSFSAQELVDCVQNPLHCGGKGGCDGATVELAMDWVMENGLDTSSGTPYTARDGTCKKSRSSTALVSTDFDATTLAQVEAMVAVGYHAAKSSLSAGVALGLKGWERLPENEYQPLVHAVAHQGPVAVSVGADEWFDYGGGIFDSCSNDTTVDHAVTLIGYGFDPTLNQKYWTIKNSWGNSWGEAGTIRLLREEGDVRCGTDSKPADGTGCDGGPSSVKVCGMCGILYDSVVPHFKKIN